MPFIFPFFAQLSFQLTKAEIIKSYDEALKLNEVERFPWKMNDGFAIGRKIETAKVQITFLHDFQKSFPQSGSVADIWLKNFLFKEACLQQTKKRKTLIKLGEVKELNLTGDKISFWYWN